MTTITSDVLVVGSTLGGIVAGVYAARAGLRVTLLEEDATAKQPPLLREPFLFAESRERGPLDQVLREIGTSPVERRHLARDDPAVQVVLPGARIDLGGGPGPVARELERFGLARREEAERWLTQVHDRGETARAALAPGSGAPRPTPRWAPRGPGVLSGRRLASPDVPAIPPVPEGLRLLVSAVVESLSRETLTDPRRAPALLLRGVLEASVRAPDAGSSVLDLLRRRFLAFHGEIRTVGPFAFVAHRREVGVEIGRETLLARALVLAAPASLLAESLPASRVAPGWLSDAPVVARVPTRLVRVETRALSSGMGPRVIDASEPTGTRWIARSADPSDERVEWAVIRGPGVGSLSGDNVFGALAPFAGDRTAPAEPGPEPTWDLSTAEMRVLGPGSPPLRSRHPLVVSVGPDVSPALGTEGELWGGRRVGLWLAEAVGPRLPRL